jgi:phosphate transport system protein
VPDELRTEYHHQLQQLDAALTRIITLVEESVAAAHAALLSSDDQAAAAVAANSVEIEEVHRSVESLVLHVLVRQSPVAGELRFLIAALRIVPEVEMTSNLAGDVARRGQMHIGEELPPRIRGLVAQMFSRGQAMWRDVNDAFADRAPEVAAKLDRDDEDVDELHGSLMAELASGQLRAPILVEMALIARFLERIADHAVEVARWIETFCEARVRPDGAAVQL